MGAGPENRIADGNAMECEDPHHHLVAGPGARDGFVTTGG